MMTRLFWIGMTLAGLGIPVAAQSRLEKKEGSAMNAASKINPEVTVRLLNEKGNLTPPLRVARALKPDNEWKELLTPEHYKVMRGKGTERAFCGIFHDNHKKGVYACVGCGLPLFRSDAKFDSGTGWPSFFQPVAEENIGRETDRTLGMTRTEIHCARCDAHLGHVFDDGPDPTRLRYCLNSIAMSFHETRDPAATGPRREKAMFGAGCFWGVEETFRQVKGVAATAVGFSGGLRKYPTYEQVCRHDTGHAEVVQVEFDPDRVSYEQLLDVFWGSHDPTTADRQGPDVGSQYRSVIFFHTPSQEATTRMSLEKLAKNGRFSRPIVTQIETAREFYRAEEYHQQYLAKRGKSDCPGK